MKNKALNSIITVFIFLFISCQETVVTNIVHPDGSITRRIVIKNEDGKEFKTEEYTVPIDSTWTITDTIEIGEKNDTTWIRKAEKHFRNVGEINKEYQNDKGVNKSFVREAKFDKKFRWFSTLYTFSENIDKSFQCGYPIEEYLNKQELEYFYMPDNILFDRATGPDSTAVKQIADSIEVKSDKWLVMCLISEWEMEFLKLSEQNGKGKQNSAFLKDKDTLIYGLVKNLDGAPWTNSDSIITATMQNIFGNEMYLANKPEIDSSSSIIERKFKKLMDFSSYDMRVSMPGEMVATNGFPEKNGEIVWPIKMEFFVAQKYEMRAESKISNTWAWVVSAIFVGFVMVGLVVRGVRKSRI
jgi:hypothetical protein